MSNKMRYWVRIDSNGIPVIGSNLARKNRPTSGRWLEIERFDCCGPELTETPEDEYEGIVFTLSCGETDVLEVDITEDTFSSPQKIADLLNSKLKFIGFFSVNGDGDIVLQLKSLVANTLCADGEMSFSLSEPA